jgi:hypothetical protein
MMRRKTFWAVLAAGMTVVSTGVVSAQWVDHETLTRMISGADESRVANSTSESIAAALRASMRAVSARGAHFGAGKNSLVGSWMETATFDPPADRVLTSLISFHDDGTISVHDQGNVTTDPPWVFTSGVGVWTRLRSRTFAYTQHELVSDLNNGNLIGSLKVRGTYTLKSEDQYTGRSFFELSVGDFKAEGWVTNEGQRIPLELPPPDPQ